jgi:hypothetical protein
MGGGRVHMRAAGAVATLCWNPPQKFSAVSRGFRLRRCGWLPHILHMRMPRECGLAHLEDTSRPNLAALGLPSLRFSKPENPNPLVGYRPLLDGMHRENSPREPVALAASPTPAAEASYQPLACGPGAGEAGGWALAAARSAAACALAPPLPPAGEPWGPTQAWWAQGPPLARHRRWLLAPRPLSTRPPP